jgi:hypothetical protein
MKLIAAALLSSFAILSAMDFAHARSGRDTGDFCFVDRSCASGLCVRPAGSRFGECCTVRSCAEQNMQCGFTDDGCNGVLFCGGCAAGSECTNFQCVQTPTSTTTTSLPRETSTTTMCAVRSCADQNKQCGFTDDGCDGFLFCGGCAAGSECVNFQCVSTPTSTTTSTMP